MDIKLIIDQLKKLDKIKEFPKYRAEFAKFLEANKLKEIGKGCYCIAYSKGNFKYVVKIAKADRNKFKVSNDENIVNPLFYSKNKIVVVQEKALTASDINKKIKYQQSVIKKLKSNLSRLGKEINSKLRRYTDMHMGNVGIINDSVKIIDLNNHC